MSGREFDQQGNPLGASQQQRMQREQGQQQEWQNIGQEPQGGAQSGRGRQERSGAAEGNLQDRFPQQDQQQQQRRGQME
ncbi:hypothetical protein DdX_01792 [Ditylenchus destructor]|uniref:Uncharacterized protein n=1 Tax=Ditylenchus destructor TaxID=166010 RepID=A0AAD4RE08_9BILA|nr:hypothetical protein DdX_01792 [Ditylenchus destructor]